MSKRKWNFAVGGGLLLATTILAFADLPTSHVPTKYGAGDLSRVVFVALVVTGGMHVMVLHPAPARV